ncbi:MAG: malectin domain-containing carbohydrate-binding protein, partial [Henriciella sp.]
GEDGDAVVAPEFETMSLRDYLPAELGGDPLNGFEPSPLTGFYIKPKLGGGPIDDALVLNGGSTNGIVVYEYIEGLHPEDMEEFDGDLFATGFDEQIIRVDLSEDGRTALNRADIESDNAFQTSAGTNPLDITIGPDGTIWVAGHGASNIYAFVPGGVPVQETGNDDNDQLLDAFDPFQLDALNGLGLNSKVSAGEVFEFTMENEIGAPNGLGGFVLGLTGHMVNYDTEFFIPSSGVVSSGVLDGGIAGKLQIEGDAVGDGSAELGENTVTYALQAGVNFDDTSKRILLESEISNVWTEFNQEAGQSQGIYFGTGTQFDFASFNFAINGDGDEVVRVYIELNDEVAFDLEYAAPGMTDDTDEDLVMRVIIDREALTVQAVWEYVTDAGPVTGQSVVIDLGALGPNNLSEAIVGAGQGGFKAREAPGDTGEQGAMIFGDFSNGAFIDLGLAVGVTGRVEQTSAEGGALFTPEFDNLLITASDEQGDFAANVNDEIAGSVAFGETLIVDVAALLANDSSFEGGTLSISSVEADGDGTAMLINGGTQVSYTPGSINDTGFTYTVADSANDATATAKADVDVTLAPGTSQVLYRVNAGSGTVAAVDDGPDWIGDTTTEGAAFISSTSASNPYTQDLTNTEGEMDLTFLENQDDIPWQLFTHERGDTTSAGNLEYAFDVTEGSTYAVTLYYVENWNGIFGSAVPRVFDVAVNGTVPTEFDDLNPVQEAADALGLDLPAADASNTLKQPLLGTAFSKTVIVTADSEELLLEFLAGTQNPKINAIEISEISLMETGPSISISEGTAIEGDAVIFTLDASETPGETITITYEIVPGTAQPGIDYATGGETPDENGVITGTATIASSATDGSIVINTIGNDTYQGDRDFTVNITGVSGADAVIGSASASGTIIEDDEAIAGDVVSAVNAGASASIDGAAFNVPGTFETDTNAAVNPVFTAFNTAKTNNNGADDAADYVGDLPNDIFFSERWAGTLSY